MHKSTSAFSQVAFKDIPHTYSPGTSVSCCYTFAAHFQPSPRDWVGIFKVGWSTTKDYHTFVWVESCGDLSQEQSLTRHAYFKDYYLPKDELDFYQFCYVDSSGQVCGASTPFCFKAQDGNDEQRAANDSDNDLLVITTQEQVEQSDREKAELKDEAHRTRQQNDELEKALQEERQEVAVLKDKQNELASELRREREQNEHLLCTLQEQQKEIQLLKAEMLNHLTNQEELRGQNLAECAQSDPNSGDNNGLLLQTQEQVEQSDREKAELKDEAHRTRQQNDELEKALQEERQEVAILKDKQNELASELRREREQNEHLLCTLQEQQKEIQLLKAEMLNHLTNQVELQGQNLAECVQSDPNSGDNNGLLLQTQLQVREAHLVIAEKDAVIEENKNLTSMLKRHNHELAQENQKLTSDIEELRKTLDDLQTSPSVLSVQPATTVTPQCGTTQPDAPESNDNIPTVSIEDDEEDQPALTCRHCLESFPGSTRAEVECHERTHQVCPFCTLICDDMEQNVFEDHVYSHEM